MVTRRRADRAETERLSRTLLDILRQETAVLRRLERSGQQTRQAVTRRDVKALQAAVAASEADLSEQDRLERRRRECLLALAEELEEPVESLTLARLAELLPPLYQPGLLSTRETLRNLTSALNASNQRSAELLGSLIRLAGDSLSFLQELGARGGGYAADGQLKHAAARTRMLDYQV